MPQTDSPPTCGPPLTKTATAVLVAPRAMAEQGHHQPVGDDVEAMGDILQPGVPELDLQLPGPHLVEQVVQLQRVVLKHLGVLGGVALRAGRRWSAGRAAAA